MAVSIKYPEYGSKKLPTRFWDKVSVVTETGCWLWTGAQHDEGYGIFFFKKRNQRAHRVTYQTFIGGIPEGLHIDHLCRTPQCCNPLHLEPVNHSINQLRGKAGYRMKGNKCIRGHTIDKDRLAGKTNRSCTTCAKELHDLLSRVAQKYGVTTREARKVFGRGRKELLIALGEAY